eukprot:11556870-Prorocentrum_lima.AAC.1
MTSSLVGSEMCIRDRIKARERQRREGVIARIRGKRRNARIRGMEEKAGNQRSAAHSIAHGPG